MLTLSFWIEGETTSTEIEEMTDEAIEAAALALALGLWDGSEEFPQFSVADEDGEFICGG